MSFKFIEGFKFWRTPKRRILASVLDFLKYGQPSQGNVIGRNRYDVVQSEKGEIRPVFVQQAISPSYTVNTTANLAYPKNVHVGNLLLVIGFNEATISGSSPQTISDTLMNSWSTFESVLNSNLNQTVYFFWATANASGADTVTIDGTGASGGQILIMVFELENATFTGATKANGTGTAGSPMSVTSFNQNALTFAAFMTDVSSGGTVTPTAGFTVLNTNASTNNANCEYAFSPSTPNTCSCSYSTNAGKNWAMAAISLAVG